MSINDILNWVASCGPPCFCGECSGGTIEGITISGGEPMEAASELLLLIRALQNRFPSLNIGMFSGYSERELEAGRFHINQDPQAVITIGRYVDSPQYRATLWENIRARLDFAILGRYNSALPCDLPLRTSANQELCIYSTRYGESDFGAQMVEISIDDLGTSIQTGFPVLGQI